MNKIENEARIRSVLVCPCCRVSFLDAGLVPGIMEIEAEIGRILQINSGYRCQKHNDDLIARWIRDEAVFRSSHPGEKYHVPKPSVLSKHRLGIAVDVQVPKDQQDEVIKAAKKSGFNGIGRGRNMLHLDRRGYSAEWDY